MSMMLKEELIRALGTRCRHDDANTIANYGAGQRPSTAGADIQEFQGRTAI